MFEYTDIKMHLRSRTILTGSDGGKYATLLAQSEPTLRQGKVRRGEDVKSVQKAGLQKCRARSEGQTA